jgi:tRNA threonylcarbamoyladenosine biosynthesis protein TsaB
MPVVLAFDTAGSACSVAVERDGLLLAQERREMRHGHAEALLPMIDRVMSAAELGPADIDNIAVSVGPGGFTGIRAGLAAAQGLTLASGAGLLGVTSFAAVASLVSPGEVRLLVALDSRRAELYVQMFDRFGEPSSEPAAARPEDLAGWVGDGAVLIGGDDADAAASALSPRIGVEIVADSGPDAVGVLAAARRWPHRASPAAHPLYLRSPDVSFPKNRAGSAK